MTVVYIDALFLLNFVVDYLLLLCAGRLAGEVLHRGRLALGAALAGAYAAAVFLPGMGFLLHPLCKLAAAVLALLIGYGGSRRLLRVTLVFFAVSAAFAGGILALELLGGRGLTLENGVFSSAMDLRLISRRRGATWSSPCSSNAPPATPPHGRSWCLRCLPWTGGGWH